MAFNGPRDGALTPSQAGEMLGVSSKTVQRMCDAGELQSHTTLGGHRRIPVASIERYQMLFTTPARNDNAIASVA